MRDLSRWATPSGVAAGGPPASGCLEVAVDQPRRPRMRALTIALILITSAASLRTANAVRASAPTSRAAAAPGSGAPQGGGAGSIAESMKRFAAALGVDCSFCHADNDWTDDTKPQWAIARNMELMVATLNAEQLAQTSGVQCATCHDGHTRPARLPPERWQAFAARWPSTAGEDQKLTMSVYSASLGVECEYCHDPSDWKSPAKPAFATAQRMIAMFEVFPKFMPPTARTQCYMCHKGMRRPAAPAR
jgi:hypothetical protein